MKSSIGACAALFAVAAVLAACNGSNNTSPPSGTGMNCGGPPNKLEVLYPIPNTKSAPGALGNIYVSTSGQLPPSNSFNFLLATSSGASWFTGPFVGISAKAIPTPRASPSYPNAVYYQSSVIGPYGSYGPIGPNQVVNLLWNDGGTGCTPHFLVSAFRTRKGS
jgi:hypothetical protein